MSKSKSTKTQIDGYVRIEAQLQKSDYTFSDLIEKVQLAKKYEKNKQENEYKEMLSQINQILKPKRKDFSSVKSVEGSLRRYNLTQKEAILNNPKFDMSQINAQIEKKKQSISFRPLLKQDIGQKTRAERELEEQIEKDNENDSIREQRNNNLFNSLFLREGIVPSIQMVEKYGVEEIYGMKKRVEGKNIVHIGFNADLGSDLTEITENIGKIDKIIRILSNFFDVDYINPISHKKINQPFIAFTIAYYPTDEYGFRQLSEIQYMRTPFSDSVNYDKLIALIYAMRTTPKNYFGFDYHPSPKDILEEAKLDEKEFWEIVSIRPMICASSKYDKQEMGNRKGLFLNYVNKVDKK